MISMEFKKKIDKIYNIFCTIGITNPLEILDQMTYIIFIKLLDEIDSQITRDKTILRKKIFKENEQNLKWSNFINYEEKYMYDIVKNEVFEFIKRLSRNENYSYSRCMNNAQLKIPTPNGLKKILNEIDSIILDKNKDIIGDVYEYMISRLGTSKLNGQFRTPIHIIDLIVKLMEPNPTDIVIDPTVGSGGFLVEARKYMIENYQSQRIDGSKLYGFDIDRMMVKIAFMNMILHGVNSPNIDYKNSLSYENTEEEKYSLILANPPFKGSIDEEKVNKKLIEITKTKKNELLFLALFIRLLKQNGRCAVILNDGVLFGKSKGHIDIKKELVDNNKLEAIISMPSGVFRPYSGVSTSIIIFKKTITNKTDNVWFYDMENDGYSLDDKRVPIEENDIQDIINRFKNRDKEHFRKRTEKSFYVNVEEIRNNKYDLSINKYKELECRDIIYEDSKVILDDIYKLEKEILISIEELKDIIEEINYE